MNKKSYLCIHGHFYQPPRENPWIEEIEIQDHVGGGFHDWNERITNECYRPNALARILDGEQQIENIINNFELISFNIGPTLLSWLEKHDRRTYDRIIEADKNSAKAHNGHGNAMAQGYNHMIMPLANRQDKMTQVKWGIADFKKRYGRQPEGMWLPETAANDETLEVLAEEGVKFTILSPHQAEKIKLLSDGHWSDVSAGNIDPTRAYRYFLTSDPKKYIDIFFYDGPVSKSVAFDDLLYDSKIYANRLESAKHSQRKHAELIHTATDGETYGHHKMYGDRVLAYLMYVEAPKRGFTITNYGEFLENFPPEYEVKIKSGENNLGTSWSCPHGVKRWADHCGCRGGGDGHWRQDWRKPLRESLDWLRDEAGKIFSIEGGKVFKDPWQARNDYIDVILDRSSECRKEFFQKHASHNLSTVEVTAALKLLEMQRNAMLMYTSCGWFFTELSGEETVQVIKYATRALQLAESVSGAGLASEFIRRLAQAKSNIEFFKNGEGVFEHLVRPTSATLEKVVSHFAISSLFRHKSEKLKIYCYDLHDIDTRKETNEDLTLVFGHVKVRSAITLEEIDCAYALLQSELYDFYCYVKPFAEIPDYFALRHELFSEFALGHRNRTGKIIYDIFGVEYYSLRDLFKEEKKSILNALSKDALDRFQELYDDIYQKHKRMIDVCRMAHVPLPEEFQFVVEHKLSNDFNKLVTERIFSHPDIFDKAYAIRAWAKETGLKLNRTPSQHYLTKKLNKHMTDLCQVWDSEKAKDCYQITKVADRLGVELDMRMAQENYLTIISKLDSDPAYLAEVAGHGVLDFIELGHQLAINMERFKGNLQKLLLNPT